VNNPEENEEVGGIELPPVDFPDTYTAVDTLRAYEPFCIYRPHTIIHRAYEFRQSCPAEVAYAVRANAEPFVISELAYNGVEWFAVNSLAEMAHVRSLLPNAKLHFTAVVKPPEVVELAYKKYRVRSFVVDHPREFNKVKALAGPDTTVLVRLHIPAQEGEQAEGERFGCSVDGAAYLMREIVEAGYKVGLCFNLGSQILNPRRYDDAFALMREVLRRAAYALDMVSIGGGYPAPYLGVTPVALPEYMRVIKRGIESLKLPRTCTVITEVGRALVADCMSVVARVDLRRGRFLYINDGTLGMLRDISNPYTKPTLRLIRLEELTETGQDEFSLSGPSGYVNDLNVGPFTLPDDMKAGDYLEFGQMGAYALGLRTNFHMQPVPKIYSVGDSSPFIILPDEFRIGYEEAYWGPYEEEAEEGLPPDEAAPSQKPEGTNENEQF